MTEAKQEVIAVSGNPLRTYIVNAAESGHFKHELGGDTFTLDALQRLLHKDGFGQHARNVKELGEALAMAGVTKFRKTVGGTKRNFYRLPEADDPPEDPDF